MSLVEAIFHEARRLCGTERDAYLAEACGTDVALRSTIEMLLRADEEAGEFLAAKDSDDETDESLTSMSSAGGSTETAGTLIGRYKLLEQIGEGGFGTVWRAEQKEPVGRHVALKIIKLGMDTRQVIARFEAERQALAMMEHPNVAKVFDAGETATGRPYFVMELVRGMPIVEFADSERLDTIGRLELFRQVCAAIQHAHTKGIIHRDIKPSNVLVTLHDGEPVVKVIDFGIAKATNARLTEKTFFTEHRHMVGTPAYMSPEQAAMSGLDVDTRSDIYSLGVLLYELLTGTTPFSQSELVSAGFAEMMRIIREQEPHRPSTRLITLGKTGTRAAELRRADPRTLGMILKGDLDWIVMKCLEKDRARRYESASGLAADIKRHLAGEPVVAAPPSKAYLFRKFVRRNRGTMAAATVVAIALVVGLIGTSLGLAWALDEKSRADEATRLESVARLDAEAKERRAVAEAQRADRSAYHALAIGAASAIRDGDGGLARRLLDEAPPRLRGWEWLWLDGRLSPIRRRIDTGLSVPEASLTPDDRHLVVADEDGLVRIFDANGSAPLREFASDLARPIVVCSSEASLIALCESHPRKLVRVFDWATGALLWEADGVIGRNPFSPGRHSIAVTVPSAGLLLTHECRTGREVGRYAIQGRDAGAAQFGPDGRALHYVDGAERFVGIVDTATGAERTWRPPVWGDYRILDAPRRRWIVADHPNRRVLVIDLDSGATIGEVSAGPVSIDARNLSPSGRRLVGTMPGAVRAEPAVLEVLDLEEMRRVDTLPGHAGAIRGATFTADERFLHSIGFDGEFLMWDAPGDGRPHTTDFPRSLMRLAGTVAPSGDDVAWGGWGNVQLWDARTGRLIWITHLGGQYVEHLAYSPDGSMIAAAETRGQVLVLSASDGAVLLRHEGLDRGHTGIAWTPDGATLLLSGGCGNLAWIDAETGRRIDTLRVHEGPITAIDLSNDGARLLAATGTMVAAADHTRWLVAPETTPAAAIVDVAERTVLTRLNDRTGSLTAATFSRDRSRFALADNRGRILLHQSDTDEPPVSFAVNVRARCIAFNAASDRLAVGGVGMVTILDAADGEALLSLRLDGDAVVLDVAFLEAEDGHESLHVLTPYHALEYSLAEPAAAIVRGRMLQRRVRQIADDLYERLAVSEDVLHHLDGRRDLPVELRNAVAEHVRARGDSLARLNSDMLVIARESDRSDREYRQALRRLDVLQSRLPERQRAHTAMRALLHHRLGEIETATELADMLRIGDEPDAGVTLNMLSIAILIEHAGGDAERASALRQAAEAKVAAEGLPGDETTRALYSEAGIPLRTARE